MIVQDNVEYITPEDLKQNDAVREMAEAESSRLAGEPEKADFFTGFLSDALKDGGMKAEVFRYLMEQHFFLSVSPSVQGYCRELLNENADAAWYALVLSACRDKKNPDGFCREILYALKDHLDPSEVERYFRESSNVFMMKAARNALLEKRGYDPAGRAALDICADVERAVGQFTADCVDYRRQNLEIQKIMGRQGEQITQLYARAGASEAELAHTLGSARRLRSENARLQVDNRKLSGQVDALHKKEYMMSVQLERIKERENLLREKNYELESAAAGENMPAAPDSIPQAGTFMEAVMQSIEESRKLRELVYDMQMPAAGKAAGTGRAQARASLAQSDPEYDSASLAQSSPSGISANLAQSDSECDSVSLAQSSLSGISANLAQSDLKYDSVGLAQSGPSGIGVSLAQNDSEHDGARLAQSSLRARMSWENGAFGMNPPADVAFGLTEGSMDPACASPARSGQNVISIVPAQNQAGCMSVCRFLDGQPHAFSINAAENIKYQLEQFGRVYVQLQVSEFGRLSAEEQNSRIFAKAMQMKSGKQRIRQVRDAMAGGMPPDEIYRRILEGTPFDGPQDPAAAVLAGEG